MKIRLLKLSVEKQETKGNESTNINIKSNTSLRERNLTTLDTIVLVALTGLLLSLSQCMRIELDSRKEKDNDA